VGEVLADPVRKQAVVRDAAALVHAEVAAKRGLRAAALKAGFRAFNAIRPGAVERAVEHLLPHFVPVIDPFWSEARTHDDCVGWMSARRAEIAQALLGVTDDLATRAKHRVALRIYRTLRGQATGHVEAAVPGLARLMKQHAG